MNADGPVLRDIHLPPDPSWWPPAPGWWLLLAIALVLLAWILIRLGRQLRQRRWRHGVLAELERIAQRHRGAPDTARLLADISNLLRRASRLVDPAAVALLGEEWLRFLDTVTGNTQFTTGVGRVLLEGPYRRQVEVDVEALTGLTRSSLTQMLAHKVPRV
jgi:hypothetical protein